MQITQEEALNAIIAKMRKRIHEVGTCHSWWDIVMDMEAFLDGKRCIVQKTLGEWVEYGEELLKSKGL